MAFPVTRLRRLRRTAELRHMVAETRLTPDACVYPMVVCPGEGVRREVRSMPGVFNLSVDEAAKEAREVHSLGVPAVILFGLPDKKDDVATGAWAEDGMVQQATRAIKREVPQLVLMGDVCLCEYMSHGHCGIVKAAMPLAQSLGAAANYAVNEVRVAAVKGKKEKETAIDRVRREIEAFLYLEARLADVPALKRPVVSMGIAGGSGPDLRQENEALASHGFILREIVTSESKTGGASGPLSMFMHMQGGHKDTRSMVVNSSVCGAPVASRNVPPLKPAD